MNINNINRENLNLSNSISHNNILNDSKFGLLKKKDTVTTFLKHRSIKIDPRRLSDEKIIVKENFSKSLLKNYKEDEDFSDSQEISYSVEKDQRKFSENQESNRRLTKKEKIVK